MADWYCDASKLSAGDYGGAWAGTATGTSGSTTLTINSNTSGVLRPGAFITGTGIAPDTQIVSGTGGPPFTSVVLSKALTASPSAASMTANGCIVDGGTVPTKAEDGNGKGSGTATMATLVITFTGIPAAAGTITIGGVTFTAVASGATGNQFNAVTDATTCATNLKNAINASTTNLVNPTPGIATAPLRNVVNATSSAGVVTVYTRTGGTEWNSVTETESLTNAVITTQWSGGGDGAWGWFFNATAIGYPTSVAIATHGALCGTYLGAPAGGDTIHVRTARSSADIVLDVTSVNATVSPRAMGTPAAFVELRFDKGDVWSSDNGIFTIRKSAANGANITIALTSAAACCIHWHGQTQSGADVQSGGQPNLRFHLSTNFNVYGMLVQSSWGSSVSNTLQYCSVLEGAELLDVGTNGKLSFGVISNPQGASPSVVRNCRFANLTNAGSVLYGSDTTYGGHAEFIDCLFEYGSYTFTSAIFTPKTNPSTSVRLTRPKFTGGNGGQHVLVPWSSANNAQSLLVIEDPVDMGQFIPTAASAGNCCGTYGALPSTTTGDAHEVFWGTVMSSNRGDRAFVIDTPRKLLEWRAASFPTTGLSVLPDNTPYSIRFSLPITAGTMTKHSPQRGIRQVAVNTLGDSASLTLTHRFLLDASYGGSSYTPAAGEWWIEGTYVSSVDGSTKGFSTRASAPTSDTSGLWSSTSYAPFAAGSRTYSAWKCTATLTDVEANTEVVCYLVSTKQPSAQNEWCFIDPQFQLAA